MLRANLVVHRAAVKANEVVDTVCLDYQGRHRRRVTLTGESGTAFLLDLDRAVALRDGDALCLETGKLVQVKAAPEKLVEIRSESSLRLMRIAWHIGNRHVPAEITDDAVYIVADYVIEDMVRGLGGAVKHVERAFEPERGAYHHAAHGPSADHA